MGSAWQHGMQHPLGPGSSLQPLLCAYNTDAPREQPPCRRSRTGEPSAPCSATSSRAGVAAHLASDAEQTNAPRVYYNDNWLSSPRTTLRKGEATVLREPSKRYLQTGAVKQEGWSQGVGQQHFCDAGWLAQHRKAHKIGRRERGAAKKPVECGPSKLGPCLVRCS